MTAYSPHPWNRDFRWTCPAGPYTALTPAQARQFDEHGFFVLEGAFDRAEIDEIAAEIDPIEAQVEQFLRAQAEGRFFIAESGAITFTTHLVRRSPRLRAFAAHPVLVGLCRDLVGADVNLYWDQAVYKKPEKPRRFPWHQDNGYTYVEPQQYLTCWVALTDATLDNGCPWIAPGLHRLGTLRHRYVAPLGWECFEEPAERTAAPVGAGGVVVFSSLTPHLTGPNVTAGVRKSYILQYAPLGARVLRGDADAGGPQSEEACDDPERQFAVLRGGAPVAT